MGHLVVGARCCSLSRGLSQSHLLSGFVGGLASTAPFLGVSSKKVIFKKGAMEERSNEDLNARIEELTRKLEGDVELGPVDIERERLFILREIEQHQEEIKGHQERLATLCTLEAERKEFSCIEAELRRRRDLVREALERDFEALEREEQEETERRRRISGSARQRDLQEEGRGGVEPNNNQLVWIDIVKSSFLETYIQMGFHDWVN